MEGLGGAPREPRMVRGWAAKTAPNVRPKLGPTLSAARAHRQHLPPAACGGGLLRWGTAPSKARASKAFPHSFSPNAFIPIGYDWRTSIYRRDCGPLRFIAAVSHFDKVPRGWWRHRLGADAKGHQRRKGALYEPSRDAAVYRPSSPLPSTLNENPLSRAPARPSPAHRR